MATPWRTPGTVISMGLGFVPRSVGPATLSARDGRTGCHYVGQGGSSLSLGRYVFGRKQAEAGSAAAEARCKGWGLSGGCGGAPSASCQGSCRTVPVSAIHQEESAGTCRVRGASSIGEIEVVMETQSTRKPHVVLAFITGFLGLGLGYVYVGKLRLGAASVLGFLFMVAFFAWTRLIVQSAIMLWLLAVYLILIRVDCASSSGCSGG